MNRLNISAKKVFIWLLAILAILLALHIVGQYLWHIVGWTHLSIYVDRFNMNEEISAPTWFATILLLASSVLLWMTGTAEALTKQASAKYWKSLAIIFLFLSIDESASIHEVLSDPMRAILNIQAGALYYAWVVPAVFLLVLLAVVFFKFWLDLPVRTRWLIFIAGGLYVGGAVGVEILGAYYATTLGGYDFGYYLLVAVEEGLEKLGAIIFIYALMAYLAELRSKTQASFSKN